MIKKLSAFALAIALCLWSVGCGEPAAEGPSIDEAPATPEAGTSDYDAYNNAGQDGPGAAHGAPGGSE